VPIASEPLTIDAQFFSIAVQLNGVDVDPRFAAPLSHHIVDIKTSLHDHQYMRTTLTIEDDVAVRLERERRRRRVSLKTIVNDVLRAGLDSLDRPRRAPGQFRTKGFNLGSSLVGSLDNVEEVLSRIEGEDHR
jgi:hypothetical protein